MKQITLLRVLCGFLPVLVYATVRGGGLDHTSYARCDQLRAVSTERLAARLGMIAPDHVRGINQALRSVLDL